MSRFTEELEYLFSQGGGGITPRQAEQMECYYEYLLETNQKYNITTVTEPKTAALKHFYDSAFPAAQLKQGAAVVDVGSGGGFPAVPLKIMRPDIRVCAVEASQKSAALLRRRASGRALNWKSKMPARRIWRGAACGSTLTFAFRGRWRRYRCCWSCVFRL